MVIEERVEIGGKQIEKNLTPGFSIISLDSVVSGFVMPRSGMLSVTYVYARHLDYPFPEYSSFNAYFFNGDSTKTDDSLYEKLFQYCNYWIYPGLCGIPQRHSYECQFTEQFEFGHVIAGDTVRFTYFSDWVATGDTITYEIFEVEDYWEDNLSVGWEVSFGNYVCNYWSERIFDNRLFVYIELENRLFVSIEPEVLFPGDTANVIIKKVRPNGTLEDFPPGHTFEVAKLDGCILGNILVNDSLGYYFSDAQQPIYFVAADSIEGDSGYVRLRIGTDLDNSTKPTEKIKIVKKKSERFIEKNKTSEDSQTEALLSDICYTGEFLYNNDFWIGDALIKVSVLDHFEITIIPDTLAENDTLAFAETARLYIQAKDAGNNDFELPDDTLLTFKIETNESYGTFINVNGDTLKTTPVILNDIPYGDANEGLIKFTAVKENPDSIVTCKVKVYLQEDTTKNGEREAVVLEQTLSIEIEGSQTVYPTYFNSNGVRVYNAQLSQKQFDIKMTRGGEPVIRHHFKLYTDYIDDSGGHDHTNIRQDNNNNYGYFLKPNDNEHYRPLEDSTSSLGRFDDIIYNASYFGDIMRIYLKSTQNELFIDSVDIIERIPNLVELEEGNNYELVGAPQNHSGTNDPCRPTPPSSQHSINHFGTQQIITNIQNIANDYAALHPGIRIRVNDISIENGGLFDVNNSWLAPHQTHRLGTNADIGFTGIDQNDNCVNLNLKDLEEIITGYIHRPPFREGDHFHITVN